MISPSEIEQRVIRNFMVRSQEAAPGARLRSAVRLRRGDRPLVLAVEMPQGISPTGSEAFALHEVAELLTEQENFPLGVTMTEVTPEGDLLAIDFLEPDLVSQQKDRRSWFKKWEQFQTAMRDRRYEEAALTLEEAIRLAVFNLGIEDQAVTLCLRELGYVYLYDLDEPRKAVGVLENALRLLKKRLGQRSLALINILEALAIAHAKLGDRHEGVKHLENAARIRQTVLGDADLDLASSFEKIGDMVGESDFDAARQYYQRALDVVAAHATSQGLDVHDPEGWKSVSKAPGTALVEVLLFEHYADLLKKTGKEKEAEHWREMTRRFWAFIEKQIGDAEPYGLLHVNACKENKKQVWRATFYPLLARDLELRRDFDDYGSLTGWLKGLGISEIPSAERLQKEAANFELSNISPETLHKVGLIHAKQPSQSLPRMK